MRKLQNNKKYQHKIQRDKKYKKLKGKIQMRRTHNYHQKKTLWREIQERKVRNLRKQIGKNLYPKVKTSHLYKRQKGQRPQIQQKRFLKEVESILHSQLTKAEYVLWQQIDVTQAQAEQIGKTKANQLINTGKYT